MAACQASLSFTNSQSLLKLMSIESAMPSSHLILCRPLLLLPSIFPSIRVFSNESVLLIRWPKYWGFSFSISPSNEHSGLISFMMDWLDLLESKGLSRVFSNATIQKHQFFSTQLSSLLFNMLSRLVITFLPRSKRLLISWLQSPSAVILEPRKIVSHCFPIYLPGTTIWQ